MKKVRRTKADKEFEQLCIQTESILSVASDCGMRMSVLANVLFRIVNEHNMPLDEFLKLSEETYLVWASKKMNEELGEDE